MDSLYSKDKNKSVENIMKFMKEGHNNKKMDQLNIISNKHTLDASLHSFDPNKCSPPNDFFVKSFIRLRNY